MSNSEFIKEYNNLITDILNAEFSNYKDEFQFAMNFTATSLEIALMIMINIIVKNPPYFEETIKESIFLYVEHEGNKIIYKYLLNLIKLEKDEDVKEYLEDMAETIKIKYTKKGLII